MSGSKLSNLPDRPDPADTPLAMTVHSLPSPQELARSDERRTRTGRLKMIILLLICAAPVIASYITYYLIRPQGSARNFGELVTPTVSLPATTVSNLQGQPVALQSLKGQWLLVVVAGGACTGSCEQNLYFQRQLREVLGKDKDRLDRVWVVSDEAPVPTPLLPALQGAQVVRVPPADLTRWLRPAAGHALEDHLYLIDPMGEWMMRFPAGMNLEAASRAKADLTRLMRASSFWDQPGRLP
jgi:hypothetical protein